MQCITWATTTYLGHIKKTTWDLFHSVFPDIPLDTVASDEFMPNDDDEVAMSGEFQFFSDAFRATSQASLETLSVINAFQKPIEEFFTASVPTHGILLPDPATQADEQLERWAIDRGIPVELSLPHNPQVLLCVNSLERFQEMLARRGRPRQDARRLARDFQRCVVVHEHFHSILETGVDELGNAASGPRHNEERHGAFPSTNRLPLGWNYIVLVGIMSYSN